MIDFTLLWNPKEENQNKKAACALKIENIIVQDIFTDLADKL